jgi:DNA processing protein
MDDFWFAEDSPPFAPAPPQDDGDLFNRLRLARSRRVGPSTFRRLLAEHGSALAALEALPELAARAGVEGYAVASPALAERELAAGRAAGGRLLALGDRAYPSALAEVADAPPLLWALGDTGLFGRPAIALIGARNASALGQRVARRLAGELGAAGLVVVSGLARGIDAAVHGASLETGTIAVFAGGIDVTYPPDNAGLARAIADKGLCLSEMPPGWQPLARDFPRRNRIVAGLSRAVVVVEAAAKSGSLITARAALDQGREVMAIPGHPLDPRAGGCNILIRDGAELVRGSADVLAALGLAGAGAAAGARPVPLAEPATPFRLPEGGIAALLGPVAVHEEVLIRQTGLSASALAAELVGLELEGRIRREGGMVALAG